MENPLINTIPVKLKDTYMVSSYTGFRLRKFLLSNGFAVPLFFRILLLMLWVTQPLWSMASNVSGFNADSTARSANLHAPKNGFAKNGNGILLYEDFENWGPQDDSDAHAPVDIEGAYEWINLILGANTRFWQSNTAGVEGSKAAYHTLWISTTNLDSWLLSPSLTLETGKNYRLVFDEKNSNIGTYGYAGVRISTVVEGFDEADYVSVYESDSAKSTYVSTEIDLTSYAGNEIRIAFVYKAPNGIMGNQWWIDNVIVEEVFDFDVVIETPNPLGSGLVSPVPGSHEYDAIVDVDLIASPNQGYTFLHWDIAGDKDPPAQVTAGRHVLNVNQNYVVQPVFEAYDPLMLLHWNQHTVGSSPERIDSQTNELTDNFDFSPHHKEISKIVFHGIAFNETLVETWIPAETEDFIVKFYNQDKDTEPVWNSPYSVISSPDVKIFDTGQTMNFESFTHKIYKFEIDIPAVILMEGWVSLQLNKPDVNLWILNATAGVGDGKSWRKGFPALSIDFMLELWGRNAYVWTGSNSDDWTAAGNWSAGIVPNLEFGVLVPSSPTNQPNIALSQTGQAHSIIIEDGATLTVSAEGTLDVYGDLILNQTGALEAPGTVNFQGDDMQIISDYPVGFGDVVLGGEMLTLHTTMEIDKTLTLNNGLIVIPELQHSLQVNDGGNIAINASGNGRVVGEIKHYVPTGTPTTIHFPVGTRQYNRSMVLDYNTAPTQPGYLSARFIPLDENYGDFGNYENYFGNILTESGISDNAFLVNVISEEGVWYLKPEIVEGGKYNARFNTKGMGGIETGYHDDLRMVKRPGHEITDEWGGNAAYWGTHNGVEVIDASQSAYWVKRNDMEGFSYFALGSNKESNPLPIELYSYTAACMEEEVLVEWVTASETNNSHFVLERAYEDGRFEAIARMEGAGNSSQLLQYAFTDTPRKDGGVIYYRLTQHDFDGQYETFAPIAVQCNGTAVDGQFRVYPNPASDVIHLSLQSPRDTYALAELYNLNGRKVLSEPLNLFHGHTRTTLNLEHLQPGIYLLRVTSRDVAFETQRVVVK